MKATRNIFWQVTRFSALCSMFNYVSFQIAHLITLHVGLFTDVSLLKIINVQNVIKHVQVQKSCMVISTCLTTFWPSFYFPTFAKNVVLVGQTKRL